jgi:hypothetical protein
VEAREHQLTVKRTHRICRRYVAEIDGAPPIKATHQCNLANAQGTRTVIPDDYFGHKLPYHGR